MLTTDSMRHLALAIRRLRTRLSSLLRDETQRYYQLELALEKTTLSPVRLEERKRLTLLLARTASSEQAVRGDVYELVAATLLNRCALLRKLEAQGTLRPMLFTGGLESRAVREFREFAPALFADPYEGFRWLLEQLFDELSLELPGLFGESEAMRLVPVPTAAYRFLLETVNDPALDGIWEDDTCLGWIYQFWNDPARESIDNRLSRKGKVQAEEISCKTQLFTERYMVEWILANTLGRIWLAICKKNRWNSSAFVQLEALEQWRKGGAGRNEPLPQTLQASWWRYYLPKTLTDDEIEKAPGSLEQLQLLDPSCGSGHFLVVAFGALVELHREEARLRNRARSDADIVETILSQNLRGVDLDVRAVQITAAALFVEARRVAVTAKIPPLSLVAAEAVTDALSPSHPKYAALHSIAKEALEESDEGTAAFLDELRLGSQQGSLFRVESLASGGHKKSGRISALVAALSKSVDHDDLGLGANMAFSPVARYLELLGIRRYQLLVGNPPYLSSAKLSSPAFLRRAYGEGSQDLFAAFLLRGMELAAPGGVVGFVTLSNWLYLGSFQSLRKKLLEHELLALVELGKGAFSQASVLINTAMVVLRKSRPGLAMGLRIQGKRMRSRQAAGRPEQALVRAEEPKAFDPRVFEEIPGAPLLFWLSQEFLKNYGKLPSLRAVADLQGGVATYDNERFVRAPWELPVAATRGAVEGDWVPYLKGADGRAWIDSLRSVLRWDGEGLEVRLVATVKAGALQRMDRTKELGIAYTTIGAVFSARAHTHTAVLDVSGASLFPRKRTLAEVLCALNRTETKRFLEGLNPTVNFQLSDVARAPVVPIAESQVILERLEKAHTEAEATNETAPRFRKPAAHQWEYTQRWAQTAVDRPQGEPLPSFTPKEEPVAPLDQLSYAFGVALGRFGLDGSGWQETAPPSALPHGILFLAEGSQVDSLQHPACELLRTTWDACREQLGVEDSLRVWLQRGFFTLHRERYDGLPIYFPLSSARRNFVAWVSIHRWTDQTLSVLLAEYVAPERRRLENALQELRKVQAGNAADERLRGELTRRYEELRKWEDLVQNCSERGPEPAEPGTSKREVDSPYKMVATDGVLVNASALWPLLDAQWREPKECWIGISKGTAREGRVWSEVAMRYFPGRTMEVCRKDPTIAVAHRLLWKFHPKVAAHWEARMTQILGRNYHIEEANAERAREELHRTEGVLSSVKGHRKTRHKPL